MMLELEVDGTLGRGEVNLLDVLLAGDFIDLGNVLGSVHAMK